MHLQSIEGRVMERHRHYHRQPISRYVITSDKVSPDSFELEDLVQHSLLLNGSQKKKEEGNTDVHLQQSELTETSHAKQKPRRIF